MVRRPNEQTPRRGSRTQECDLSAGITSCQGGPTKHLGPGVTTFRGLATGRPPKSMDDGSCSGPPLGPSIVWALDALERNSSTLGIVC